MSEEMLIQRLRINFFLKFNLGGGGRTPLVLYYLPKRTFRFFLDFERKLRQTFTVASDCMRHHIALLQEMPSVMRAKERIPLRDGGLVDDIFIYDDVRDPGQVPGAVESEGKLAVTWGHLKK